MFVYPFKGQSHTDGYISSGCLSHGSQLKPDHSVNLEGWRALLVRYVKIVTGSVADEVAEQFYPQFIDFIELLSMRHIRRLSPRLQQFQEALTEYKRLHDEPPTTLEIPLHKLALFQDISVDLIHDLRHVGIAVLEELVGSEINRYCTITAKFTIPYTDYLTYIINRYNRFSASTPGFLFHPFFKLTGILSAMETQEELPLSIAIGPKLLEELLTVRPFCALSMEVPKSDKWYDVNVAKKQLKKVLALARKMNVEDHETFLCVSRSAIITKPILAIEDMLVKVGFYQNTVRNINTYKLHPCINGKALKNAPDFMFVSLTKMFIRDIHASPELFCWIALIAELAIESVPKALAISADVDYSRLRTIPLLFHTQTLQKKTSVKFLYTSFIAEARYDLTTQQLCEEFLANDHSKLYYRPISYILHLSNSLPYATLPNYAMTIILAYFYLRFLGGHNYMQTSFTDIIDIYNVARDPQDFFALLEREQYTPEKAVALASKHMASKNYMKINRFFVNLELQLLRNSCLVYNLPKKYFNEQAEKGQKKELTEQMLKDYINLEDPISRLRIKVPVRGINCRHVKCFDLEAFVDYTCTTDTWVCPICSNKMGLSNIYVDIYQLMILNYLRATGNPTRKVEIDPITHLPIFPEQVKEDDSVLSNWLDD